MTAFEAMVGIRSKVIIVHEAKYQMSYKTEGNEIQVIHK